MLAGQHSQVVTASCADQTEQKAIQHGADTPQGACLCTCSRLSTSSTMLYTSAKRAPGGSGGSRTVASAIAPAAHAQHACEHDI